MYTQDILWKDMLVYKGRTLLDKCTVTKVVTENGGSVARPL